MKLLREEIVSKCWEDTRPVVSDELWNGIAWGIREPIWSFIGNVRRCIYERFTNETSNH